MTALGMLLAWLALADGGAQACGPGDARAHITRGHALSDETNEVAALAQFRCAFALDHSAEALAQIALTEMALGLWVEAAVDLGKALGQERDPWIRQRRPALAAALEKIRDNLGELVVDGKPAGAEILIDGRVAGKLPLAQPVILPAGRVDIEVRARGHQSAYRQRRIEPRVLARETVELVPAAPPATVPSVMVPAPVAPDPNRSSTLSSSEKNGGTAESQVVAKHQAPAARWPAWLTLGAGVASLGGGIAFHALREGRAKEFNDDLNACGETKAEWGGGSCVGLHEDVTLYTRLAIGGYVAAGVLGLAAVYLFVSSSPDTTETPSSAHALVCAPDLAGRGIACAAHF